VRAEQQATELWSELDDWGLRRNDPRRGRPSYRILQPHPTQSVMAATAATHGTPRYVCRELRGRPTCLRRGKLFAAMTDLGMLCRGDYGPAGGAAR